MNIKTITYGESSLRLTNYDKNNSYYRGKLEILTPIGNYTSFWGSMGEPIQEFFKSCDNYYIIKNLISESEMMEFSIQDTLEYYRCFEKDISHYDNYTEVKLKEIWRDLISEVDEFTSKEWFKGEIYDAVKSFLEDIACVSILNNPLSSIKPKTKYVEHRIIDGKKRWGNQHILSVEVDFNRFDFNSIDKFTTQVCEFTGYSENRGYIKTLSGYSRTYKTLESIINHAKRNIDKSEILECKIINRIGQRVLMIQGDDFVVEDDGHEKFRIEKSVLLESAEAINASVSENIKTI